MFLLIQNADVYTPEHIGMRDLLICNGSIAMISEKIDLSLDGMEIFDAHGYKLLPGFIDQHVHITGGGGESGFASRVREISLPDITTSGVTTVVGLLGTDGTSRSVENLVAKTKALNEEGITAYCLTGSYEIPTVTLTGSVRRDMCFVQEIIGCKVAITDHRSSMPTREELTRLATEVRVAGMLAKKPGILCMHTGTGKSHLDDILAIVRDSDIPIKHFRPTHIGKIVDDAIAFSNAGGFIDFTAGNAENVAEKIMKAVSASPLEHITMSSDSNGSMPIWNDKRELIVMGVGKMTDLYANVRHMILNKYLPESDCLRFITENPAKALAIEAKKGHVAVGADADFVLVDDEWNIDTVIARGSFKVRKGTTTDYGFYRY